MSYRPPLEAIECVLTHVSQLDGLLGSKHFDSCGADEVRAILEAVAKFAGSEIAPLRRIGDLEGARLEQGSVLMPRGYKEAYASFVDGGYGATAVGTNFGGLGLPHCIEVAALELIGGADMAFGLCPILTAGAVDALLHHGSEGQRQRYLQKLVSGEWTGTMNLTEPQAGSDVGAVRTMATPGPDGHWSIRGTKIFISFGDHDLASNIVHLILARTPEAPAGTRGLSLFVAPKFRVGDDGGLGKANGIKVASLEHKLGLHASPTCALVFGEDDPCLGELVGPLHGGMRAMFTMMNNARLNIGLQGVQIAERARQAAIGYAKDRIQSRAVSGASALPVPIIEHPDVRRMLVRMTALTHAARALIYFTALQRDHMSLGARSANGRLELLTPLAKAYATDVGNEVASLAIQVHGGAGYVEETGVAQLLRDVRITSIYEGTNGIQAADLVSRKIGLDEGEPFAALILQLKREARNTELLSLIRCCADLGDELVKAPAIARLSASYPFLTMLSVAVCGWLLERMLSAELTDLHRTSIQYYLERIVPEAMGLEASASPAAGSIFAIGASEFA